MFRILMSALVMWGVGASVVYSQPPEPADGDAAVAEQPAQPRVRRPAVRARVVREAPKQLERKRLVYRLHNVPAQDIAVTISELSKTERAAVPRSDAPGLADVIVLPEVVTNSLVLSGPSSMVEKVAELIEALDEPPPMVQIEVLIVEVSGGDEVSGPDKAQPSKTGSRKGLPVVGASDASLISAEQLKQELRLAAPKASAAGKDVEQRISALERQGRLRTIRRPHVLTLSNQPAYLKIGRREPMVRGTQTVRGGRVNTVSYHEAGLSVAVRARVSPDGIVTMEIDVEESRLQPAEEGVVVAETDGQTTRVPRTITTDLKTTVKVADGQTVVLGGLATKCASREEELLILVTAKVIRE